MAERSRSRRFRIVGPDSYRELENRWLSAVEGFGSMENRWLSAVEVEGFGALYKGLDPAFVGSAYLFLKKKKDIRLRRALGVRTFDLNSTF